MKARRTDIGHVRSANPARREVRVDPLPGRTGFFEKLDWVYVAAPDGGALRCKVAQVRQIGSGLILTFSPGLPRDRVSAMKGAAVAADVDEEAFCEEREVEAAELMGFEVYEEGGGLLGPVVTTYATAMNQVVEIERSEGRTMLLPLIPAVIAGIDRTRGAMTVRDIAPYKVEDED